MNRNRHPSSYRDPSGYIFHNDGILYRQINSCYADDYMQLKNAGLLDMLIARKMMIGHEEINTAVFASSQQTTEEHSLAGNTSKLKEPGGKAAWMIIQPEKIQQISLPSEWTFDALRDAALLHLDIMQLAIGHGMVLKDASGYNVQFKNGKAVFIDTLSFQCYNEKLPWVAYRQFCENFLYPLLIEHYKRFYVHQIYPAFPDGISAKDTAGILPSSSRFNLGCWLHVYLPASVAKIKPTGHRKLVFNKEKLQNLLNHLNTQIKGLKSNDKSPAAWNTYYAETILGEEYLVNKKRVVIELVNKIQVSTALDLGCNDGFFSKLMQDKGITVVAVDNDAPSVNRLYLQCKKESWNILPLVIDIAAPTPATGFRNLERQSFLSRLNCELILALALVHHLVIGKNIPLQMLAAFFQAHAKWLIIEFVPKEDPKVIDMLANREDVFHDYNQQKFEQSLSEYFEQIEKLPVEGTQRWIYLYKRKDGE